MSSTSLVTNGYICYGGQPIIVPQPVTCDSPDMKSAIEIRPRIRQVLAPRGSGALVPSMVSAQELKPQIESTQEEPGPTPVTDPPSNISAQELKPIITAVKEED